MRDLRPSPALSDLVFERYLAWRQASVAVSQAYGVWTHIAAERRAQAFAAYQQALDEEEEAAADYRDALPGSAAA